MYLAVLVFWGLAGLATGVLVGASIGKRVLACRQKSSAAKEPTQDENAVWDAIRAAWTESYSMGRTLETRMQKTLLSWGRTLSLCAGLCLVGILLETEYGCPISIDHIVAGLVPSHSAITISSRSPSCPQPPSS